MSRDTRCPHLLFHDVLGPEMVGALLDYVAARQGDFISAPVQYRQSGQQWIDRTVRDCFCLVEADVGIFKAPLRAFLDRIAARALQRLGLLEHKVEPREFEISAYS